MAYYYFNNCPETCIPQIENLARKLNLEENSSQEGVRQWMGPVFERKKVADRFLLVRYVPVMIERPLMLKTSDRAKYLQDEHKRVVPEDVKSIVRIFMDICKPTVILDDKLNPYDLGEFR